MKHVQGIILATQKYFSSCVLYILYVRHIPYHVRWHFESSRKCRPHFFTEQRILLFLPTLPRVVRARCVIFAHVRTAAYICVRCFLLANIHCARKKMRKGQTCARRYKNWLVRSKKIAANCILFLTSGNDYRSGRVGASKEVQQLPLRLRR